MFKVYYSRAESFAHYIIENKATIRQTAKQFNYSKSLVHNDISNKLKHINLDLYFNVKKVLDKNFREKHIRGGLATKQKYKNLKAKNIVKTQPKKSEKQKTGKTASSAV